MRTFVVLAALVVFVMGCGGAKSKRFTASNQEEVIAAIGKDTKITDEERKLILGGIMRLKLTDKSLDGKTVQDVINDQRAFIAQRDLEEAQQKKLAAEAKAKEEALAAEMRKAVAVTLIDKVFRPSSFEERRFDETILIKVAMKNTGTKNIRAFRGGLIVKDLFGQVISRIGVEQQDELKAGEDRVWEGSKHYNQFDDSDRQIKNAEMKDVKVEWVPMTILFSDGTKLGKTE